MLNVADHGHHDECDGGGIAVLLLLLLARACVPLCPCVVGISAAQPARLGTKTPSESYENPQTFVR